MGIPTGIEVTPSAPASAGLRADRRRGVLGRIWADRWIYLFLLPTVVLYTLYTLWPIVASYWYSLLDWNGFEDQGTYVGLENYRRIFQDHYFWSAFRHTFVFALITVPVRVGLSLVLAIMLNNPRLPFASVFRTALFLPVVTTTAIIGVIMTFIFDPAGGPVNAILLKLHIIDLPVNFLGDSSTALYTVMIVHVWKWFGVTLIYWLAALQTIPNDLYEASRVDGANAWRTFWGITLPSLLPFLVIIVTLSFLETIEIFDLMLTMTNGGPFYSTEVIDLFIYRQAFASATPQLGYASAAAVAFGLTTLGIALIQVLAVQWARRVRRSA